jgi:CSLREA domain-containing protein
MKVRWVATFVLSMIAASATPARAAKFTVDTTTDSPAKAAGGGKCESRAGGCTLRAAVEEANASAFPSEIEIPAGTYTLTSAPAGPNDAKSGDLFVRGELRISGAGRESTILDGGGLDRVFEIGQNATVTISDLTVQKGLTKGAEGGGILSSGQLTLRGVTLRNNRAKTDPEVADGRGAALCNRSLAKLEDVRVETNVADGRGGGIYNAENASLEVLNGTIRANLSETDTGGGISNEGTLKVTISSIDGNRAADGGGIGNLRGQATLLDSTISGNQVGSNGGGIQNTGTLSATNVTISGNSAGSIGGGLANEAEGRVSLNGVTIAQNKAPNGGGILNKAGVVQISNSVLAGNTASPEASPDCGGVITSGGYNLIEKAAGCELAGPGTGDVVGKLAKLSALADNDGPTRTHALEPGSPAIDAGNPAPPTGKDGTCAPADQRGVKRPQAGGGKQACDIGAYELSPKP